MLTRLLVMEPGVETLVEQPGDRAGAGVFREIAGRSGQAYSTAYDAWAAALADSAPAGPAPGLP